MAILTVYTKLLDKTLEGARIIDMGSTKSCECFVLPRDKVAEVAKKQPHLQQYGFYILLGRDKNYKPMAYIGQTNDFTNRVNDHKQKKKHICMSRSCGCCSHRDCRILFWLQ